jgi:hypothetical protein
MKKKHRDNITEINIIDNQCPIPLESLAVLVTGDDNKNFKSLSKHISGGNVKVMLKHRTTGERVKVVVPTDFLDFHKILYKNAVIPTNTQIAGILDKKVKTHEVESIIKDIWQQEDLVIVKCLQSGKKIACKVPVQDIEQTSQYIEKSINKEQSHFNYSTISIWRESQCQREIQVRQNLQQLISTQTLTKA